MESTFCASVRAALAIGLERTLNIPVRSDRIRLPARGAAAGCAVALEYGADADAWAKKLHLEREAFPQVLGAPLLFAITSANGWLLFHLHDALYQAAAMNAAVAAGPIGQAHENYALHRLRMLARHDSEGCPNDPAVQRALLLCFAANEAPTDANRTRAEEALLSMAHHLPPAERTALLARCGDVARAAAHLLYGC